jgi:hypothetical protein
MNGNIPMRTQAEFLKDELLLARVHLLNALTAVPFIDRRYKEIDSTIEKVEMIIGIK